MNAPTQPHVGIAPERLITPILRQCRAVDPFGLSLDSLAVGVVLQGINISAVELAGFCRGLVSIGLLRCQDRRYYINEKGEARAVALGF